MHWRSSVSEPTMHALHAQMLSSSSMDGIALIPGRYRRGTLAGGSSINADALQGGRGEAAMIGGRCMGIPSAVQMNVCRGRHAWLSSVDFWAWWPNDVDHALYAAPSILPACRPVAGVQCASACAAACLPIPLLRCPPLLRNQRWAGHICTWYTIYLLSISVVLVECCVINGCYDCPALLLLSLLLWGHAARNYAMAVNWAGLLQKPISEIRIDDLLLCLLSLFPCSLRLPRGPCIPLASRELFGFSRNQQDIKEITLTYI